MARGITESDVFKACDMLLEGARPTIERVRQTLGRGSPNTISPMLETWFKHLGARIKDPGAFSAPAGLSATEAVAKRFESALKAELSATGQLSAVEGRLAQLRLDVRLEARTRELETALAEAQQALSRAAAPEALAEQIMAKIGAAAARQLKPAGGTGQRTRKKRVAA